MEEWASQSQSLSLINKGHEGEVGAMSGQSQILKRADRRLSQRQNMPGTLAKYSQCLATSCIKYKGNTL